jgi:hypothetical protein
LVQSALAWLAYCQSRDNFVERKLVNNYPSSPQLKHLEPKPEFCASCPPCPACSGQSLEK